ncbi:DUF1707 SHOCT-like domain-containing protein [Streptomyces lavendulae]|uniref:DUF1707 SHOCT-like domain-containing protein n=1 Tax=Streptomyces lavendulae TaxID=1914 RepID=UPI0024A19AE7|nr:DUF1707 domain-containing protein [Streptomyces lavendulae]GLX18320.1 hypothetical protein Slala01_19640 [Streptomyces lavendulae subsp. lavendulae]GLX28755.1 hypothetical protein Slala02_45750 [Streptomyces lavendulae subsp. lavendulae]
MSDERPEKPLPEKTSLEKPSVEKAVAEKAAAEPPALRASDADRERVVDRLRDAVAEGRLDMEEFEERLEAAYTSRTYAELEPLTRDLPAAAGSTSPSPVAPSPAPSSAWPDRIGGTGTSATAVAVMSGFQRKGRWTVPARFNAVAIWGGGELDLREADFAEREVVITCVAVMGGIEITVPPGVEVDVRGIGIMGAFDQGKSQDNRPEPGAPRVVVNGLAFWGGVAVKVKQQKGQKGPKGLDGGAPRKEL